MEEYLIPSWLERTELLIGKEAIQKLGQTRVLLVGLGGVGSFAGEFLVRSGIGHITIVDGDKVESTNKNRQLQALDSTIGVSKMELLQSRFLDIHPMLDIKGFDHFMEPEDMSQLIHQNKYDFILDCIDSLTPKITLIKLAKVHKIKIISAMGAGGKTDPSKVKIADISETKECKFAQSVRKRLKKEGIRYNILTVYSEEIQPDIALKLTNGTNYKKSYYGTISYMPALFGLYMASEVIRRTANLKFKKKI